MDCYSQRIGAYRLVAILFLILLPALSAAQAIPDDPIAYTGHGQYFAADGTEIDKTLEFVDSALDVYQAHLLEAASESQRAMFESMASRVLDVSRDAQANLVVRANLVDWLARSVITPENPYLLRRLRALDYSLQRQLTEGVRGLFDVPPAVQTLIDTEIPNSVVLAFSTEVGGDMYVKECRAAGVPIPPAWGSFGSGEWVDHGILTDEDPVADTTAQEFIDSTKEAQVYTYESDAPDGVCIALPRANDDDGNGELMDPNDRIAPLGIICLGRATGNACFWDAIDGEGARLDIDKGEVVELTRFAGGADLRVGPDACTECHAGENPFTIHPGTALQPPGVSFRSPQWYNPLVVPEWPQNAGPANNVDSIPGIDSCTGCHTEGGSGGRFPQLSTRISGYCNNVLAPAINRTMPIKTTPDSPGPGEQAGQVHTEALRALCNDAPVPILRVEEELLDFGEVEIGFAFTKALLIHNDGDAPLIIDSLTLTTPRGEFTEISEITSPTTVNPGDPPRILRQTFEPTTDGPHTAQLNLQSSVIAGSLTISLEGVGKNPEPIDSVLVLDRSGSMADYAGDRTKIMAMRDASSAYMDLLREAQGSFAGDRLGIVKYNNGNADYLALDSVTQPFKDGIATNELSSAALNDIAKLRPNGGTGIGGALERGAAMIGTADPSRAQVLVVMTDGVETQSPFIEDVLGPIGSSNAQLQLYSVGVGDDIEPGKLQSITNQGELGYHQVSAGLDAFAMFDLESFYFKIFANAAGMDLAVDPTHSIDLQNPDYINVDEATVISSDRSANFIVLEDPALRSYYDLEFLSPKGEVIKPGSVVGNVPVQIAQRHTYTIYKIVFPDRSRADEYVGQWVLRLKPNGKWSPDRVRNNLAESPIDYSGLVQPLKGQVPIGFAAAVGSNYRFEVSVTPENFEIGSPISLVGSLSDRRWPSADGKVQVEITYPNGAMQNLKLFDDASGIDSMAGDAIWSRRLSNTSLPGVYRFLFRAEGKNLRGELAPREATRYLTLTDPKKRPDENCPPNPDDLCGELKRRVQALDDALTLAMNDKDEARIKAIYNSIQKLLARQDACRALAEELQGTYEILVDAWFQEDRESIANQQIILSELLRYEPTSKDCTPSRSGTCDDTRRILVRSTRSLVETMDLQRDLNSGQILDRIKRIIGSNPECEVFEVNLLPLYEQVLESYASGEEQRSDALLTQIYKTLSR